MSTRLERYLGFPNEFRLVKDMAKHQAGTHDQQSHGNWASGGGALPSVDNPKGESSPEANRLAAQARERVAKDEPQITQDIINIANMANGKMVDLEYRLKSEKSLARKIDNDAQVDRVSKPQAASKISDVVRYTMEIDSKDYSKGVRTALIELAKQGYTVDDSRIKNFWESIDMYQGVNAKVQHPNGYEMELQFHTPESYEVKNQTHALYEVYRQTDNPKQRYKLYNSMKRIAKRATAPSGVMALGVPAVLPLVIGGKEFLLKMLKKRFIK